MKFVFLVITLVGLSFSATQAQTVLPEPDKSPMDISYFPNRYPLLKIQDKTTEPPVARAIYSRPQKNGRIIFSELLEYGKVWRMGANEATEIEFYKEVMISDVKIKKGRYTLYGIPNADKWTLIINKDTDTWGSFRYNTGNDIVRIDVPVQKQTEITEAIAMVFEKTDNGADLIIAWDDIKINLPIVF